MLRETVSVDDVLEVLNRMVAEDRVAASALVEARVPCNLALAEDPAIQVGCIDDNSALGYEVGLLGVINGLFGADEFGGAIAATFDVVCGDGCVPVPSSGHLTTKDACPRCGKRLVMGPMVKFCRFCPNGRSAA